MPAISNVTRSLRPISGATAITALLLGAAITPAANAQTQIVLTGGVARGNAAEIVALGVCLPPTLVCNPGSTAPAGHTGGTAYDPVHQLIWHTNGSSLDAALASSTHDCDLSCVTQSPVPNASGLAFDASTKSLWILGLAPELARATTAGDCPQVQSRCSLAGVIPPTLVAAGLALSEKRGLLFYSASSGGSSPVNIVFAAPISDPCNPICRIDLGPAFGAPQSDPILGLAYDDCDDELFAVAGSAGIVRATIAFPGCTVRSASHCAAAGSPRFHGLCVQPPNLGVVGSSCVSPPCAPCSSMRLRGNNATLGNSGFAIWAFSAPAGSFAIPVLGLGACGAGVNALCGRFHPSPVPFLLALPPIALTGPSPCTGSGSLPLPIPADGSLCGAAFCVQMVVGCPAGGLSLTNALAVTIAGA